MMSPIEIKVFLALCIMALGMCMYLAIARCYNTGVIGSIGLGLLALGLMVFVTEAWQNPDYQVFRHTGLVITGLCLFFMQHIFRVIHRNRADRRRKLKPLQRIPEWG